MSEQLKRGERIPGSKYFRWYCDDPQCGQPMRVADPAACAALNAEGVDVLCTDCGGNFRPPPGVKRPVTVETFVESTQGVRTTRNSKNNEKMGAS